MEAKEPLTQQTTTAKLTFEARAVGPDPGAPCTRAACRYCGCALDCAARCHEPIRLMALVLGVR